MSMTRKEFIGTLIGAGALLAAGCGGDDGDPGPGDAASKSCTTNGTNVNIESNHGHVLMVSKEDVTAGADKTYNIQGTATHPHTVMVTAANFTSLKNNPGMSIMVTSSTDSAHSHGVTIMCA
jgi:hypothetical protein